MFELGQTVKVLYPFTEGFPDVYEIIEIVTHDDGQIVYILSNDAGGFDGKYLEAI